MTIENFFFFTAGFNLMLAFASIKDGVSSSLILSLTTLAASVFFISIGIGS